MTNLTLGRDTLGSFEASSEREWLVTNGIGGFAAGTLSGVITRRYQGLLVASLRPPVERTVMVVKLDATARYGNSTFELATNEYLDGTVAPQGFRQLQSFRLEGQTPVWSWLIGDAVLEQRLWMAHGENTTYVTYHLLRAAGPVTLELQPLCTWRDYHWLQRGARELTVRALDNGFEVCAQNGARPYRIVLERGDFTLAPDWHWNLAHRDERARGLDDAEDLFRPAIITLTLQPGESTALVLTAESHSPVPATLAFANERRRQQELVAGSAAPEWIEQLIMAADQFVVERRDNQGAALGTSVIAGYPWFSDWGRDTMIALPGLTLATGRVDRAAEVLRTFARFVSEGMLPNRFPDGGPDSSNAPEYNTVDATLWYFIAVDAYLRQTHDAQLRHDLYPILKDIVAWHLRGTRYGIHVDSADSLLSSGAAGVQLTWMDAKVGDWVVTPRIGKCVEINALWFNALMIMHTLATDESDSGAVRHFATLAERVARNFNERFWFAPGGYLADVVDGPEGMTDAAGRHMDVSVRPNQIFAVSLPHPLLDKQRSRAVVATCGRELWTPVGLRSLAPRDPHYIGRYEGGPRERDGAYHQGTVWSWLLGPFVSAHFRVHGDLEAARGLLAGMAAHLREGCIGQVSEIFDGDAPFAARGCYAQAWGVAELLRCWSELK